MDEIDLKILRSIETGIPITREPFREVAAQLGIAPQEVVARLIKLKQDCVIRKFGASLKPNNVGFSANALIAWKVPQTRIQEIGTYLADFETVSHCYERKTVAGKWDYNLYTVMHAPKREDIQQAVNQISSQIAVDEYKILYSTRDLKTVRSE